MDTDYDEDREWEDGEPEESQRSKERRRRGLYDNDLDGDNFGDFDDNEDDHDVL